MLKNECSRNCWLAAAVAGLLVWIFNGTFIGGLVLGLITFFLLGSALIWLVCTGRGGAAEDAEVLSREAAPESSDDGVLNRAEQAVVDAGNAFAAGTVAAVAKGREALQDMRDESKKPHDDDNRDHDRGEDEREDRDADDDSILERAEERLEKAGEAVKDAMGALAARGKDAISTLKNRGDDDADEVSPADGGRMSLAANVSPAGQSAVPTDPEDAAAKPAATPVKPEPRTAAADDTAEAGQPQPKAAEPQKATDAKADTEEPVSAAGPDDLKEIKGVGPALEGLLHENGVTSFAQIAGWGESDIDHYAELIGRMGGRIRSDDWVSQAKVLAKGGSTEFSRRVDKGEVY
ncbi:hypothetical protein [Paracoccus albus]|uniref:hypothetical protein n=1 Tax=Paracoccus albus TaxID=3017784 RepID=UPI0022EFFCDA|nr:hypothetical protein [Paracoccus albus]WBU60707.1 hypothetical protein PAF20_01925 [Paracoccus albus]